MGFGFGALLMSKVIAPALDAAFQHQLPLVFAGSGAMVGITSLAAALCLHNPPQAPPPPTATASRAPIWSRQFVLMWLVFFCNIVAGIAIISFQSPLLQDLWKNTDPTRSPAALAAAGATLIAVSSVFNGLGRLVWGGLSDRLGQLTTFRLMLASQVLVFLGLMQTSNPWLFGALICYVLLCYGGGFGVMPSFVLNEFGPARMPVLYGCILTAWSAGGVVGPQMVAWLKDHCGPQASSIAFALGAGLLALGFLFSLFLRHRQPASAASTG